jgi:hypothetical protein
MNIWRRGPLTQNPYLRTAFRVARVPREITRRRTLVRLVNQTRHVVSIDPQAHTIRGAPVTMTKLNAAEQILLDPPQRILEELLEHAAEAPPLEQVRKLAAEATRALAEDGLTSAPVTNLRGLQLWAHSLAQQFLESVPGPDPSFGALELDIVPPFGHLEEA